eukprot:Nk52_evm41s250 gene=Nk52_evmTU41s250
MTYSSQLQQEISSQLAKLPSAALKDKIDTVTRVIEVLQGDAGSFGEGNDVENPNFGNEDVICFIQGTLLPDLMDWHGLGKHTLKSNVFKLCLGGLELLKICADCSCACLEKGYLNGSFFAQEHLETFFPVLLEKMGDGKAQIRDLAFAIVERSMMMLYPVEAMIEKLASAFSHKAWRVRESALRIFVGCLQGFTQGPPDFPLSPYVGGIVGCLDNQHSEVREMAFAALGEIYQHVGYKLRGDLAKRNINTTKMNVLNEKFDAIDAGSGGRTKGTSGKSQGGTMSSSSSMPSKRPSSGRACTSFGDSQISHGTSHTSATDVNRGASSNGPVSSRAKSAPHSRSHSGSGNAGPGSKGTATAKRSTSSGGGSNSISGGAGMGDGDIDEAFTDFSDCSPIIVTSERDLASEMNFVYSALEGEKNDWEFRVRSMRKLRSLLNGNCIEFDEFFTSLKSLGKPLSSCVRDLRSQVSREACITISHLARTLKNDFETFASDYVPSLLKQVVNSARVMAQSADFCNRQIIVNTHCPKLLPLYIEHLSSKSATLRAKSASYLELYLTSWGNARMEKSANAFQEAIVGAVSDADPKVRNTMRSVYWIFVELYPERQEKIFRRLDGSVQKLLIDSQGKSQGTSVSSSVSHGRQTSTNGSRIPSRKSSASHQQKRMPPLSSSVSSQDPMSQSRRIPETAHEQSTSLPGHHTAENLAPPKGERRPVSGSVRMSSRKDNVQADSVSQLPASSGVAQKGPRRSVHRGGSSFRQYVEEDSANEPTNTQANASMNRTGASSAPSAPRGMHAKASRVQVSHEAKTSDAVSASQIGSASMERKVEPDKLSGIAALCTSASVTDRVGGFEQLGAILENDSMRLSNAQVTRIGDVISRHISDPLPKIASMVLDNLYMFIMRYKDSLSSWLETFLDKLFCRLGSCNSGSVLETKLLSVLNMIQTSFPSNVQFAILFKLVLDPISAHNSKVKKEILTYLLTIGQAVSPAALVNSSEFRLGVQKVVTLSTDPRNDEISQLAVLVLTMLSDLNEVAFIEILRRLPMAVRTQINKKLSKELNYSSEESMSSHLVEDVSVTEGSSRDSSPYTSPGSFRRSMGLTKGHDEQREVLEVAPSTVPQGGMGGKREALYDPSAYVEDLGQAKPMQGKLGGDGRFHEDVSRQDFDQGVTEKLFTDASTRVALSQLPSSVSQRTGRESVEGLTAVNGSGGTSDTNVINLLQELAIRSENVPKKVKESSLLKCFEAIGSARKNTLEEVNSSFPIVLDCLVQLLTVKDPVQLKLTVKLVKAVVRTCGNSIKSSSQNSVLLLTSLLKVLCWNDNRDIARAIGDLITMLLDICNPLPLVKAVIPFLKGEETKVENVNVNNPSASVNGNNILPGIKAFTQMVVKLEPSEVQRLLPQCVPELVKGYNSPSAEVRKAVVFCLVEIYLLLGEELTAHLRDLNSSQMKLLTIYINRAKVKIAEKSPTHGTVAT